MAYSAPELLLVGAAQNLVLAGGSNVSAGKTFCDNPRERENIGGQYDDPGLW